MQHDVIILGATFAAAGFIHGSNKNCLILESRPQAGCEFLGALNYGTSYDLPLHSDAAKALLAEFKKRKVFQGDRICLFDCAPLLYAHLAKKQVMLNVQILSVEKSETGYTVTTHSVSGYRIYKARHVIDTRTHPHMIASKTFNVLLSGQGIFSCPNGTTFEKWGSDGHYVLKFPVAADEDYTQARKNLAQLTPFLPPCYRILLTADTFHYSIQPGYPCKKAGILYMPSAAYANPLAAFDAGVLCAQGGMRQ